MSTHFLDGKNTGAKSVLCYGVMWDSALTFIEDPNSTYPTNSVGWGNYSGGLLKTGFEDAYKFKNIYDMAGNVHEWTMESAGTTSRVVRGGYFGIGSPCCACLRGSCYVRDGTDSLGFRIALYVKDEV